MLPMVAASCGSESGGDLFVGGRPKTDAGNTGGMSATGGAAGTGARGGSSGASSGGTGGESSGGSAGAGDASAGASGTSGRTSTGGMAGSAGSGGTAGTAGKGGTAGTAGSGGTAGTAGTGNPDSSFGAGGTAGSAGANGRGGTAGADAGADATADAAADSGADASADAGPKSCTNSSQCKNDEFCSKAACVSLLGECKPRPKACTANESPVCGCDGVNYWNDCLRQQVGSPSSTSGECLTPATCGGLASLPCPVGRALCAHLLATELQCGVSDAFGACWVIPEQCPRIVVGANQRACGSGSDRCESKCEAIKTQHDYFTDSTCPQ